MSCSSHILLLGSNSVHSLVPSTLIAQVESLLESHKLDDAFVVADTRRKKLEESIEVDEDQAEELRYVYQLLGFQQFRETLFEDAGNNLFNGQIDPRLLVSYYPHLRGALFTDEDAVDVFSGVAERMPKEASVDDIITNYAPHLKPDTESSPPTAELRKILQERALEMLEKFLKKERRRRMALDLDNDEVEVPASPKGKEKQRPKSIRTIIDTVLAKIYAQSEKTTDLYDLLFSPNYVLLSEVEDVFRTTGQYNALCLMYQRGGSEYDENLLDVWSKVIDGEWTDPDIPDPLLQMMSLLTQKRDTALSQKWGIWMLKRDQAAAIRLLTSLREAAIGSGKRRERERAASVEDLALLEQIDMASPSAAKHYLEYLVLQKRSQARELHDRLALACVNEVLAYLRDDDSISKLWRAKASSYASTSKHTKSTVPQPLVTPSLPPPFFSYFASTTPESPSKRARLSSILMLAGSQLYDPETIKNRILEEQRENILALEVAVLEGKAGNHRSALTTLARHLNDAASAEAYCNLQGEFIPPKVAVSVAESAGLAQWVEGLSFGVQPSGRQRAQSMPKPKPIDPQKSKDLLKVLLEVYMSDESPASSERASQLLSAQAMNLDVLDVLDLVPPSWPLPSLTPFLSRSFRRITHQRREVMIAKHVSAGQNLEVKEATYEPVRMAGAFVEELEEDDEGGEGEEYDEKRGLVEKVVEIVAGQDGGFTSEKVPLNAEEEDAADSLL